MLTPMLPIDLRVARAERLVRMIEQDAPLLAIRVAPLSRERQEAVKSYAAELAAIARAELKNLLDEKAFFETGDLTPHPAD